MGFMIFGNGSDGAVYSRLDSLADIFIRDTSINKPKTVKDSSRSFIKDITTVKKFTGDYIDEKGRQFGLQLKNNKLYLAAFGNMHLLDKINEQNFSFEDGIVRTISLKNTQPVSFQFSNPFEKTVFTKYISDTLPSLSLLQTYTGKYYCPELDCSYEIIIKDKHLFLANPKYNDTPLTILGSDHLRSRFWWMGHLQVLRNNQQLITGFEVNDGRIMHLRFNKLK